MTGFFDLPGLSGISARQTRQTRQGRKTKERRGEKCHEVMEQDLREEVEEKEEWVVKAWVQAETVFVLVAGLPFLTREVLPVIRLTVRSVGQKWSGSRYLSPQVSFRLLEAINEQDPTSNKGVD